MGELEQVKRDNATLEDKNKSFLKLVASLKQQLKEARAGAGAGEGAGESEAHHRETVAALESEIRQKDAITSMQQRVLEETQGKARELSATVDQLLREVQEHRSAAEELEQLRALGAASSEEKRVLSEECQRLRDRVERAERELTRSKTDQRARGNSGNSSGNSTPDPEVRERARER